MSLQPLPTHWQAPRLQGRHVSLEALAAEHAAGLRLALQGDALSELWYTNVPKAADAENKGRPNEPLPMVLVVHGGPWGRDAWGFDAEHQLLANRGYAVLSVNFRGSTGLGKGFTNAGNKEWAGKMHDDLIDAVDWAIAEKIADPKQVAIMGGSYGG